VLVAAGFFVVGHVTATQVTPSPQKPITVTASPQKTITVTATAGNSGGSTAPGTPGAQPSAGGRLAAYSFDIPPYCTVPLGSTRPAQSQFQRGSSTGDLYLDTNGMVGPGSSRSMSSRPMREAWARNPPTWQFVILAAKSSTPLRPSCTARRRQPGHGRGP